MALLLKTALFTHGFRPVKQIHNLRNTVNHFKNAINRCENSSLLVHQRCCSTKQNEKTSQEGYKLIYNGPLSSYIYKLKGFSLMTTLGAFVVQPLVFQKAIEGDDFTFLVIGCTALLLITAATPLLIHIVTKKYVTHLYYNEKEDKYLANTYTLFLRRNKIEFTPENVVVPDITGMFSSCKIKGFPLFFDENHFDDISHYKRILGYDKPLDFEKYLNRDNIVKTDQPQEEKNK